MKLSITLVHNKNDKQNEAQITALKELLLEVVDGPFLNEETGEEWTTIHHELKGLPFPHEVKIYQVIPYGVTPPQNRYEINSGGIVQYGEGDNDKTGDHSRFFNWGFKRGSDNGAEISIHIEDIKKFNVDDLAIQINSLIDPEDKHEYAENQGAKIVTLKLIKKLGQLDESKTRTQAFNDLKAKSAERGLKNG